MLSRESFYGSHRWHNGKTPGRMLKKAGLLTRPTPARRDAPCPKQGRSSMADPRFTSYLSRFLKAKRERRWRTFSASCKIGGFR